MTKHDTPPTPPPLVRLPDIPLSDLSERTKDFIIAASGRGRPVTDVMVEALNHAAAEAGFISKSPSHGRR